MHSWEQIQKTLDYIEEHIDEKFDIDTLAEMASLSKFYYQRLFKRLVKKNVSEYIWARRLGRAVEILPQSDRRILDIAVELGFSSHEHFTRSFKEAFGVTPAEYREKPTAMSRMTKPELLLQYALIDEGVPLITEGIVLEINRKTLNEPVRYIGYRDSFPIEILSGLGVEPGVDPLDDLWQSVHALKKSGADVFESDEELGVTLPAEEGKFAYFAGGKGRVGASVENGAEWSLPSGEYLVTSFAAENFQGLVMDALYKAEQYVYNVWLPNHKLKTDMFCAEIYPTHSPETCEMEVWMRIVPEG